LNRTCSIAPATSADSGSQVHIEQLETPGLPVGIVPDDTFGAVSVEVPPKSSLLIYSDGAIEIFYEPGKLWGIQGLTQFVHDSAKRGPVQLADLYSLIKTLGGSDILGDDFSTVLARFE
jgi:sigma-B regulation protein RsbU (phosphoserine phosphatase)